MSWDALEDELVFFFVGEASEEASLPLSLELEPEEEEEELELLEDDLSPDLFEDLFYLILDSLQSVHPSPCSWPGYD